LIVSLDRDQTFVWSQKNYIVWKKWYTMPVQFVEDSKFELRFS
jgi:hypothetical protein